MSNQVQCPNCGGFKVDENSIESDPKSGRKIKTSSCGSWIAGIIVAIIALACISMASMSILDRLPNNNQTILNLIGYGGTAFCIGFGILIVVLSERNRKSALARAKTIYNYYCQICGYRWSWRAGDFLPQVTVRSDLIAKGSDKFRAGTCRVCGQPVSENVRNCSYCGTARW